MTVLLLVISALAVYRLTRLVVEDSILDYPRLWVTRHSGWGGSLVSCYWCAGFWISLAATLTLYLTSSVVLPVVGWLFLPFAFSAFTGILSETV